jgi:rod shape determining protein RodA
MFQRNFIKNLDWTFLGLILLIMLTSLIILSSASANIYAKHPYYFLKKQLIWILIGFIAMVVVASLNYSVLIKASNLIYVVNIVLLLLVLAVGSDAKGAQRWISIGGFEFQPSEFAKIAIIITFANVLTKRQGGLNKFRDLLPCFAHIGVPMLLILKQPDLGTSLVFMAIMMGMLWVSGANPKIQADKLVGATGYDEIALTSLSTADYTCVEPLIKELIKRWPFVFGYPHQF